ncbi:MAG: hypothetical protein ACK55I_23885, partial [bacterium]
DRFLRVCRHLQTGEQDGRIRPSARLDAFAQSLQRIGQLLLGESHAGQDVKRAGCTLALLHEVKRFAFRGRRVVETQGRLGEIDPVVGRGQSVRDKLLEHDEA